MVNFDRLYDPFSITDCGQDYNPHGCLSITKEVYDLYVKSEKCLICRLKKEAMKPECLDNCLFRIHPVGSKDEEGNRNPVVVTKSNRKLGNRSLLIRRGLVSWNYSRGTKIIMRSSEDNGFHLHHLNGNKYDDRPENVVMILNHSKLTSAIIRVENSIEAIKIYSENDKRILKEVKKISKSLKYFRNDTKDSPEVFEMLQKFYGMHKI